MIAVLSGKIINAWKVNPNVWLLKLKQFLGAFGSTPARWEIFGGNAFLLKIDHPEEALFVGIIIKAIFRQVAGLDVALSIGIGDEDRTGNTLRESSGTAFERAQWSTTDKLPKKATMKIYSDLPEVDEAVNLLLAFALINMNDWSLAEAEIVELCLLFPEKSQQELAAWLRIKQSAVSQRRARAHLDLLLELDAYYRTCFNK